MLPREFLLSYAGFDKANQPIIEVQQGDAASRYHILGNELSLQFDLSIRYCTGWVDMLAHQAHPCPDSSEIDSKYEQCVACRNKTGFNPAFYHATNISNQQVAINQNPHFVYLAYFAPGLVKVGISQAARGLRRILEQGARFAAKLETFPSATIARQYEAKIAALEGIVETVLHSRKVSALATGGFSKEHAKKEMKDVKQRIEAALNVTFDDAEFIDPSEYFNSVNLNTKNLVVMAGEPNIIGEVKAIIGRDAIVKYDERLLAYDLKSYTGYRARQVEGAELELPSEQMTLF